MFLFFNTTKSQWDVCEIYVIQMWNSNNKVQWPSTIEPPTVNLITINLCPVNYAVVILHSLENC